MDTQIIGQINGLIWALWGCCCSATALPYILLFLRLLFCPLDNDSQLITLGKKALFPENVKFSKYFSNKTVCGTKLSLYSNKVFWKFQTLGKKAFLFGWFFEQSTVLFGTSKITVSLSCFSLLQPVIFHLKAFLTSKKIMSGSLWPSCKKSQICFSE